MWHGEKELRRLQKNDKWLRFLEKCDEEGSRASLLRQGFRRRSASYGGQDEGQARGVATTAATGPVALQFGKSAATTERGPPS